MVKTTKGMIIKKAFLIALAVFTLWLLVSVVWLAWSRTTYSKYCDGMIPNEFSNIIVPRYYTVDSDYTYLVKYPDYLSLTGNLGITANDTSKNVAGFLIWPPRWGNKTEYGIIINEDQVNYRIYTDNNGNPIDAKYQDIVNRYADEVDKIVQAANAMWDNRNFSLSGSKSISNTGRTYDGRELTYDS